MTKVLGKESEIKEIKEKFETGDYICLANTNAHYVSIANGIISPAPENWVKLDNPKFDSNYHNKYKLINKKHNDILNAFFNKETIKINDRVIKTANFISSYNENNLYIIEKGII